MTGTRDSVTNQRETLADGRDLYYEHVRTDEQIQRAVVRRLDWSPVVASEHIGVAVTDGAVTLAGEVGSAAEADAALEAATAVGGVSAVVNEIVVSGPEPTDADIARELQHRLAAEHALAREDIVASVRDRQVTLSGTAGDADAWRLAVATAQHTPGVRTVVDQLKVLAVPTVQAVRDRIGQIFADNAMRECSYLQVGIDGHTVVLQGTVQSCHEQRAAERAAAQIEGVTDVRNELAVSG